MKPNKIKLCIEKACRNEATTDGFCRFHYLKNWRKLVLEKEVSDEKADKLLNVLSEKSEPEPMDDYDSSEKESFKHALEEIGIKEKDLKKDDDGNPFASIDLDTLIENMKYDEAY